MRSFSSTGSSVESLSVSDDGNESIQSAATTEDRKTKFADKQTIHSTVLAHKYREAKCPALSDYESVNDKLSKTYTRHGATVR